MDSRLGAARGVCHPFPRTVDQNNAHSQLHTCTSRYSAVGNQVNNYKNIARPQTVQQFQLVQSSLLILSLSSLLPPLLFQQQLPATKGLCIWIQPQHHIQILQRIFLLREPFRLWSKRMCKINFVNYNMLQVRYTHWIGRTTFWISSELISLDKSV